MKLSDQHRQQIRKRGFSDEQINWMVAQGFIRSLTWEEVEADWLVIF